jgi:hypothetical protein
MEVRNVEATEPSELLWPSFQNDLNFLTEPQGAKVIYLILTFRRKLLTTFAEGTKSFLV